MDGNGPHWSGDVYQADWIAPRLTPGLRGDDEQLRREVHDYLTFAVLDLTGT
ncbi:MAG: hypothetical protein ACRDP5_12425 [Streptosporangiaceae bacterium]